MKVILYRVFQRIKGFADLGNMAGLKIAPPNFNLAFHSVSSQFSVKLILDEMYN